MKNSARILLVLLLLPLFALSQKKGPGDLKTRLLTTKELTDQADVVVLGRVSALQSEWNAEKTRIYTRVSIDVREFLKGGEAGNLLTVLTLGGEIGDVGELYSGTAVFRSNEEIVVFAKKKADQDHVVVGGDQGRVPVIRDKETGEKLVHKGVLLDDFRSEVRSAARANRPGEK